MFERGDKIRQVLFSKHQKQVDLVRMLASKGIETQSYELSAVLSGMRKGPKADKILEAAESLLGIC